MNSGFSETIIIADTNPIRFENFCRAICERSEQLTFVPTSFNYDKGRDARSIAPGKGSHRAILCVTLNQNLDAKVESDLRMVSAKSHPDRLVYCCSQPLTEHRIDEVTKAIRRFLPKESIQVLSSIQLADLAEKYPDVLPTYYPGEIQLIRSRLLDFEQGTETTENRGLRLALIAFGSEDAITLRRDVSCRAVLEVLCAQPDKATEAEITNRLSSDLRLPKILDLQYIRMILKHLSDNGWAEWQKGSWKITKDGRARAKSVPVEAARALLNCNGSRSSPAPFSRYFPARFSQSLSDGVTDLDAGTQKPG